MDGVLGHGRDSRVGMVVSTSQAIRLKTIAWARTPVALVFVLQFPGVGSSYLDSSAPGANKLLSFSYAGPAFFGDLGCRRNSPARLFVAFQVLPHHLIAAFLCGSVSPRRDGNSSSCRGWIMTASWAPAGAESSMCRQHLYGPTEHHLPSALSSKLTKSELMVVMTREWRTSWRHDGCYIQVGVPIPKTFGLRHHDRARTLLMEELVPETGHRSRRPWNGRP